MGKAISVAGWLVFIAVGAGAVLRTEPDDPAMGSFKSSALYRPVMVTMSVVVVASLVWVLCTMRTAASMQRKLDELKRRKAR